MNVVSSQIGVVAELQLADVEHWQEPFDRHISAPPQLSGDWVQASQAPAAQMGLVPLQPELSVVRHSTHVPLLQNGVAPLHSSVEDAPQPQLRSVQVSATSGSHATPQLSHWPGDVDTHSNTPSESVSQQSWSEAQPA
jgi:hypothetical protein